MIVAEERIYYPSLADKGTVLSREDASGDYCSVTLAITTPEKSVDVSFGDHYHDKGQEKAEGVLEYLVQFYGRGNVMFTSVNLSHGDEYLY